MSLTDYPHHIVPIFAGGGTRLTVYLGIIEALQDLDIKFDTLVGVSGGSIIAALHAKGWSQEAIYKLACDTDFTMFRQYSIWRLLREGGLSSGDIFEQWMDDKLQGVTFSQLEHDLHVVATDVANSSPVVFNKEITPDMKVSKAVRFSMSIPLIFTFKEYYGKVVTDGAILSEDALFWNWRGDNTPVVCFRIQGKRSNAEQLKKRYFKLPQYVGMLIKTFIDALSREFVHHDYWNRTVVIDTGNISAIEFNLSVEQKKTLFKQGFKTVKEILPIKLKRK